MIIVEGLDNSGKDTLIELLRRHDMFKHMPTVHVHHGAPPKGEEAVVSHTMYELFRESYFSIADWPSVTFVNRGHISGCVYDQLYRPNGHSMRGFYSADGVLNPDRDVLLYVTAHPMIIAERDDGLSTYSQSNFNSMVADIQSEDNLFRATIAHSQLPTAIIDTSYSKEHALEQALAFLSQIPAVVHC